LKKAEFAPTQELTFTTNKITITAAQELSVKEGKTAIYLFWSYQILCTFSIESKLHHFRFMYIDRSLVDDNGEPL